MAAPFDPSLYLRAPIFAAPTGVSLSLALVEAAPASAPASVKKAVKHLR